MALAALLAALPFTHRVGAAPIATAAATGTASAAVTTAAAPPALATPATPPGSVPTSATGSATAVSPAPPAVGSPVAAATVTSAAAPASASGTRSLDEQIQDLKRQTVELNRDLFVLEEDLLFPANTQVAVFVSVDVGDFFALDSINLKIDNKEVSNYLYTPREVAALLRGGVQRLYVGNLKAGSHELVAFFNGKGPNDRYYRRAASLRFEKGLGAKYLELKVTDHQHAQQPEFEIKDWQ
ncbi:MAG TPA: hypothetical protein VID71_02345 [Steroidobacteraceae bacterium]